MTDYSLPGAAQVAVPRFVLPRFLPWIMLGSFALMLALLGGSSRFDAVQLAALRPLAAMFLIPTLYFLSWEHIRWAKVLVSLIGLIVLWTVLQLVPLPPGLWHALPDRQAIVSLDRSLGLEDVWRPISLVPTRGYDALASFIVPISAFLLALAMNLRSRDLLLIIAALGVFDALLGLTQVAMGAGSPLYFYTPTNGGSPVGIFANENHSAVFSTMVLLVITKLALDQRLRARWPWYRIAAAGAFLVVLLSVTISGSRAGIVIALFSVACSVVMVLFSVPPKPNAQQTYRRKNAAKPPSRLRTRLVANPMRKVVGLVVLVAIILALVVMNGRAPGLESAFADNVAGGLRWQLWPTLVAMVSTHWVFGTGFGSFEEVYHIYEPTSLLLPVYFNHAHNDWAQFVIEGGLPALLLLGGLLAWLGWHLRRILGSTILGSTGKSRAFALFWAAAIITIMAGSIVDYPLRAPTFQAVAIWFMLALALESDERAKSG